MNIIARTALAAFIASVVPAIPFLAISIITGGERGSLAIALIAWAVGAAHIAVLGIPAFAVLWRKQIATRLSLMVAGFLLGFLPLAIVSIPNVLRGGGIGFGPFVFAVLGGFSAWVFWVAWLRLGPNSSFKPNPPRHSIASDPSALISTSDTTRGGSA